MSGGEGEDAGGNPTGYLLVLAPLVGDGVVEGVIEVFQRPDSQPATQRGYLRFLIQMCELAGRMAEVAQAAAFQQSPFAVGAGRPVRPHGPREPGCAGDGLHDRQ